MINRLHRLLHDPNRGWDPISQEYAEHYAKEIATIDSELVARVCALAGSVDGRHVADVGSGPGQYGLEFALRGARVTCIDISRRYLDIARRRFADAGRTADFVLTYMDDIGMISPGSFDVLFNNVCWYYCVEDYKFARSMLRAARNGGLIVVRVQNAESLRNAKWSRRLIYGIYGGLGWKIGHLLPPRGLVERVFRGAGGCDVSADYTDSGHDVVVVRKAVGTAASAGIG